MSYPLCFRFAGFNRLPHDTARLVVQHLTEALWVANIGILQTSKRIPLLYESGITYRSDDGNAELQWWDIPAILEAGYGDCKGLAAWRAAESGGNPIVLPSERRMPPYSFHVIVKHRNGILEDPSVILGG